MQGNHAKDYLASTDHQKKARYIYVQLNDYPKLYQILRRSIPKYPAAKKGVEQLLKHLYQS